MEAACYRAVLGLAQKHAGEIDRRYPKILRRVGGYNLDEFTDPAKPVNLAKIMVGSEGTLGIVLEAKLRLVALPKAKAVMVIMFADLLESLAASPVILRHQPSAVEVMDKSILDYTRQNAELDQIRSQFIEGDPASTLCVEFYADRKEDLPPRLQPLEDDLRAHHLGYAYRWETEPAEQAKIWSLREASLGLSTAMKGDAKSISFVEDTAVAPEKLRDFIERFLQILESHGTTAGIYAHASVGCLHVRPVINLKTEDGVRKFEAIAQQVADLVLEFGGALSAEHGDGLARSPFNRQMFGPVLYEAFREVKRTFDPLGILNPGKIVDAPPLTSNLRFGAGYLTPDPKTWFDYSVFGGMGRAVEMCSGVGACRKKLAGTMCPSYMATCDETHSPRGRANALRLAMAGRLGEAGLADEGVYQALELCLECRACKSECPVGVDVARFKSEFLAGYWLRHGTPLRARSMGNIHRLSVWGSRFAPLANWLAASRPVRALMEASVGMDRRRTLPAWKHETFERWLAANRAAQHAVRQFRSAVQRYIPESFRSRNRHCHAVDFGAGRAPRECGAARLLRPSVDFPRSVGRSAKPGGEGRQRPVSNRRARSENPVLRTQLPFGCERGCTLALTRRPAAAGARGCGRLPVFRRFRLAARPPAGRGSETNPRTRALPSEVNGPAAGDALTACANSRRHSRGSGRRLLRHGGIVRVSEGALRSFTGHRQPPPASGRAGYGNG